MSNPDAARDPAAGAARPPAIRLCDDPFTITVTAIAATTILRLVLAGVFGLGIDESYTASIARQWSLSYYDHPPLHVWLIGAMAHLTGSQQPLVLRLPFILLFAASSLLMFRLTAMIFGARAGMWAAIAFNLIPVFTLSTASWLLPDGPMVFFLLAFACVLARLLVVTPPPAHAAMLWLVAGVLAGLALLSKYSAAFPFAGLALFAVTTTQGRRALATPWLWLGVLVAGLTLAPVVIWNAQHEWISLAFQAGRAGPTKLSLTTFAQFVGGELLYLLPWICVGLVYVLFQAVRQGPRQPGQWFFACAAIVPLMVIVGISLQARALPHWAVPGWLFVLPLFGAALARWEETRSKQIWRVTRHTAYLVAGALLLLTAQAATGWVNRIAPPFPPEWDPTLQLYDWRDLRTELQRRHLMDEHNVLAATKWIEAGKVSFAVRGVPVICLCPDPHHFAYIDRPDDFVNRDVIVVSARDLPDWVLADLRPRFERIEKLDPVTLTRAGAPVMQLSLLRGIALRGQAGSRD